jgi:UDP-N-acetylmuramate dehydrogenase
MKGRDEAAGIPLSRHTTVAIGGPALALLFPRTVQEAGEAIAAARAEGTELLFLGGGSNLLVSDRGVEARVLSLKRHVVKVLFSGGETVVAEGGVMLPRLAVLCALSGYSGLEELSGIPGTLGGAVTMNAGAWGRTLSDLVEWVEVAGADGRVVRLDAREIAFDYREARLPVPGLVVRAALRLGRGDSDGIFERMKEMNERRRASQPWGERTFGSAFRNPPGEKGAGALLERAGFKGARRGDACFSPRHANFVVNLGRATASDVAALLREGREAVRERFGVELVPEVKFWGGIDA